MNNNQVIRDEQKVTGIYCDVKFSGVVMSSRTNQAFRAQIIYTVSLDEPIMVYGQQRNRITIESNSDGNQIEAVR